MKFFTRLIWVILFIVFFGFALKNTHEAALRLFFDYEARGPPVLILLAFFTAGAALGILAMMPTMFRHRRDLVKYKKTIETMQKENEARALVRTEPPPPDSVAIH